MKVLNIIFILVFISSAALQYNDPDPYIWIPVYLFAAWLCYQSIKGIYRPGLYYTGLAVYILYALYLFFDKNGVLSWQQEHNAENIVQTMKAAKPWIEETREFGGLLICIAALLINMIGNRKKFRAA